MPYNAEYQREYRTKNKARLQQYQKQWKETNREHVRNSSRIWIANKRASNPEFRLRENKRHLDYERTDSGRKAKQRADHKYKHNHPERWGYIWAAVAPDIDFLISKGLWFDADGLLIEAEGAGDQNR